MSDRPTPNDPTANEFIRRLGAADPVDPSTLPSADSPEATQMLADILTADSVDGRRSSEAPVIAAVDATGRPTPTARRSGLLGRGRGALVAVAAAVAVVAGGVVVLAPDNTPAALAEVRAAAASSADADTGRISTTFSASFADDTEQGAAGGSVEAVYADDDLALSITIDELDHDAQFEVDEFLPVLDDIRLVDDVAYVQRGDGWVGIETGGLLGDMVVRYVDPRTVFDTVQALTEATEDGMAEVDGVTTTRYHSEIDLGDDSLAQAGWLAFEGFDIEADGEVIVDLYVDDDGMLRRFDIEGELLAPEGETGQGTFEVSTTFSDLGADLSVEVPEGAEIIDPMAEAFDE